ncbi:MAG: ABC transporter ATP-binding protein [Bacillota bacterium]|nr:ABC transporter ATP-binding protein [Bacillota bacterium]
MTPIVRLEGVQVVRGGRPILDVGSLTIEPGELLGIVGPNGSGKSTLLKVLAMVLVPDTGQVSVDGKPVSSRDVDPSLLLAARRRVTMVFQSPVLLMRSVFDNVAAGLRFRGAPEAETRRRTAFWLDRLGIGKLAGRRPGGLSGGEVQRVALARALVLEPDLLLLDEPTANLDWPTRTRLFGDLRAILGEIRAGAVLVTHDIHEAPHFADRLAVMRGGRVVQSGIPAEVMDGPADVETAVFLGYDNVVPAALVAGAAAGDAVGAARGGLGAAAGGGGAMFCIGPDRVRAMAASGGRAAMTAAGEPRGGHAEGRLVFTGQVAKLAPWGPLYRVSIVLAAAREGILTGTCPAQDVIDGSVAEGKAVALVLNSADGVLVPPPGR